jgi:hypothetical protein
MAYVSQDFKKKVSPIIKQIMQKYKLRGSLSVNHHSTLVLTIKQGELDIIGNYNAQLKERNHTGELVCYREKYMDVNTYWIGEQYTGKVKECLEEILVAMKGPDFFDKTDIMTDYFHVSHYINIHVGRWDKPYVVQAA